MSYEYFANGVGAGGGWARRSEGETVVVAQTFGIGAAPPTPPQPPLPPPTEWHRTSREDFTPVDKSFVLYPMKHLIQHYTAIQTLLMVHKPVVVVGIMGSCASSVCTFANNLMGKVMFDVDKYYEEAETNGDGDEDDNINGTRLNTSLFLQMHYSEADQTVYVVGVNRRPSEVLETLMQEFFMQREKEGKNTEPTREDVHAWLTQADADRLEALMFIMTIANVIYHVNNEQVRFTTNDIRDLKCLHRIKGRWHSLFARALQEKFHSSIYSPGKLVPILVYVYPISLALESALDCQDFNEKKRASCWKTYRRNLNAKTLLLLLESLRSDVIGKVATVNGRIKDLTERSIGSRDKRLFNLENSSTVLLVQRDQCTNESSMLHQIFQIMTGSKRSEDFSSAIDAGVAQARTILKRYLEVAFPKKEGGSNVERPSKGEPLLLSQWLRTVLSLQALLLGKMPARCNSLVFSSISPTDQAEVMNIRSFIQTSMDTSYAYSTLQCQKNFQHYVLQYQKHVPEEYNRQVHEHHLAYVVSQFRAASGPLGPACERYAMELESVCQDFWNAGRRLCDAESILGASCQCLLHRLPSTELNDFNKHLPVMNHSTHTFTLVGCNCGATMDYRPDPFDMESAKNKHLYESPCCLEVESLLTIDQQNEGYQLSRLGDSSRYNVKLGLEYNGFGLNPPFLYAWKIKRPLISLPHGIHLSQKNRKKIIREQNLDSMAEECIHIYVGLEYECPRGHRFILKRSRHISPTDKEEETEENVETKETGNDEEETEEDRGKAGSNPKLSWPEGDCSVYLPCLQCNHAKMNGFTGTGTGTGLGTGGDENGTHDEKVYASSNPTGTQPSRRALLDPLQLRQGMILHSQLVRLYLVLPDEKRLKITLDPLIRLREPSNLNSVETSEHFFTNKTSATASTKFTTTELFRLSSSVREKCPLRSFICLRFPSVFLGNEVGVVLPNKLRDLKDFTLQRGAVTCEFLRVQDML